MNRKFKILNKDGTEYEDQTQYTICADGGFLSTYSDSYFKELPDGLRIVFAVGVTDKRGVDIYEDIES